MPDRLPRLRIPRRLAQRWRARLRAQRRWWRERWRTTGGADVLFPPVGHGMVAVETLTGGAADDAAPAPATPGPRIAILHATAGGGHKQAAKAIATAVAGMDPGAQVREVDTLVFASQLYRRTYVQTYNAMAARAPRLWGLLYRSSESARVNRGTAPLRLGLDRVNLRRLVSVVERESPDAVVCTHFLPVEALSPVRGRGRLRVPLYCVITDFTAHPFWAFPHVDRYFVASDGVAAELAGHGVDRARVEVTGIPIEPRFAHRIGREAACRRFRLDPARPVVAVLGGGTGVGPLGTLAERLARLVPAPQIVVACGTNARLRSQIEALPAAKAEQILALGFTHEMDAVLEACDVAVSKAGGLTCAEALTKHTPLVFFLPMPGQEVANAAFLEAGGAAVRAGSVDEVAARVETWIADPAARERARAAAERLARPRAAETVARRVLEGAATFDGRAPLDRSA